MRWYVRKVGPSNIKLATCHLSKQIFKGDKFSSKKIVSFNFYRAITDFSNMIFSVGLIIFTGSGEPSFFHNSGKQYSHQTLNRSHTHCYPVECKTVATLKADLSSVPHSEFARVNSGNGDWYKVSYDIEMSFEATLSFSLSFKGNIIAIANDSCLKFANVLLQCRKTHGRMCCGLWSTVRHYGACLVHQLIRKYISELRY